MRLGVIDIGSNTVHVLVMEARHGARPVPQASQKSTVRLMRYLRPDGSIAPDGVAALTQAVDDIRAPRTLPHEVTQVHDPLDTPCIDISEHRFERRQVAVDIRDQGDSIESHALDRVTG
jgi:hypothetical protein